MPRTRRSSALAPATPAATARHHVPATPTDSISDAPSGSQMPKRRTVASNAKAIDTMGLQLLNMTQILEKISGRMGMDSDTSQQPTHVHEGDSQPLQPVPPPARAYPTVSQPLVPGPSHPPGAPAYPLHVPNLAQPPHAHAVHPIDQLPRHSKSHNTLFLFATSQPAQPAHHQQFDPLGSATAQTPFRDLPTSLQDLEDIPGLQDSVAHLLSTTLAPLSNITGKKLYAHSFVKRGSKRARTTLGDLSLPEYNTGFIKLLNSNNVSPADRPYMFTHLAHINEDAATYEWQDVRYWSEEVCALVAEASMTWDDRYNIDLMRLKFSQKNRRSREVTARGQTRFTWTCPQVRAAKPAPPCRAYNNAPAPVRAIMPQTASAIYTYKCAPLPHPEKECCSKQFKKKQTRDTESGFGK